MSDFGPREKLLLILLARVVARQATGRVTLKDLERLEIAADLSESTQHDGVVKDVRDVRERDSGEAVRDPEEDAEQGVV